MKSIRAKYLVLILCCILVTNITIVVAGVKNANGILSEDSTTILNLQCTKEANEMNRILGGISQSVKQISNYALEQIGDPQELLSNQEQQDSYVEKLREISVNAAETTDGAVAVYLRFNKDLTSPKAGFFITKEARSGRFIDHELTDLSQYAEDDMNHVGWYYIPMENGKGTWLDPYENQNLGIYMISYVIPIYKDDVPIAVVGMDIDMSLLRTRVSKMQVYDSGYAFLWSAGGDLLYHPDYPEGVKREEFFSRIEQMRQLSNKAKTQGEPLMYKWEKEKKYLRSQQLDNGMTFSICVEQSEIDEPVNRFIRTSVMLLLGLMAVSILFTIYITGIMVRPIRKLTESAQKMIEGDLDVDIVCESEDEVGVLAESFHQMARKLKEQLVYIRNLAYFDSLTGVKNKTAYEEMVGNLEDHMKAKDAMFAVVVMDINNLKHMNDTYGHELGDRLISDSVSIMKKIFPQDRLYRIGGDEFVALLSAAEIPSCRDRLIEFQKEIARFNTTRRAYKEELHVAAGASIYDEERDKTYTSVFRRADSRMYKDKIGQKKMQQDGGTVR
ncbi:MAG: diguanylate cyclase [Lachnospiraceae bacterium]|nr:diguanylate cyclase [Agathobacter sp.]MDD6291858.1 diguanylate cyclase [Lachnospiraceae bacterium]